LPFSPKIFKSAASRDRIRESGENEMRSGKGPGRRGGWKAADSLPEAAATQRSGLSGSRTLVVILAAVLIIALVIAGFKLYTVVSESLVVILTPETASLSLLQGETGSLSFSLRTNNYLFCEASCDANLTDLADGRVVEQRQGIVLKNSNASLDFPFTAPTKGEGQRSYTLSVTCRNIEQQLCLRGTEPHLAAALITVDYSLPPAEQADRGTALGQLRTLLAGLRQLDLATQEVTGDTSALQGAARVPLDGLEEESKGVAAQRDSLLTTTAQLISLWNGEEYVVIVQRGVPTADAPLAATNSTLGRIQDYVAAQQSLVSGLQEAIGDQLPGVAAAVFAAHEDGMSAANLSQELGLLRSLATDVAREPAASVLTRSKELADYDAERQLLVGRAAALLADDVTAGNQLIAAEELRLSAARNASNPSGNATNESTIGNAAVNATTLSPASNESTALNVTSSPLDLSALRSATIQTCAGLRATVSDVEALNLTPTNESAAFLTRCDVVANVTQPLRDLVGLPLPNVVLPVLNLTSNVTVDLAAPPPSCCAFGSCNICNGSIRLPVLFLHGHSMNARNAPEYSLEAFSAIQQKLQEEGLLIDAGFLTPYSSYVPVPPGDWGKSPAPVSVAGTYYYDAYLSGQSYILSVAKSESIDTYAIRLKELIGTLKQRTGHGKVVLVTHSMGGLVARRYLQLFGSQNVASLIMIAPPSHGINSSLAAFCPFLGADRECAEMRAGSAMLAKLNDPSVQPSIPALVIVGRGCDTNGEDGDGVVTAASADLPWATTRSVNGSCTSLETLHTGLLDPARYPEAYAIVKEAISFASG
jgi:pimeloyl-ACP methyl ester carboxylesterase